MPTAIEPTTFVSVVRPLLESNDIAGLAHARVQTEIGHEPVRVGEAGEVFGEVLVPESRGSQPAANVSRPETKISAKSFAWIDVMRTLPGKVRKHGRHETPSVSVPS